jgi:methyl-accepting chemotaxis protein
MKRNKRRLFPIVSPSYQYRFLALVIIYCSIIVAFLAICIFVPDILQMLDENLSFEVRADAAKKILVSHSWVWPPLIALVCIIGVHSFLFFHRFIGPLYRFRWAFEKMRGGDLAFRIKLRKNDFLHQEEQAINEMIEALAGKIRSMQRTSNQALKSFNELKKMMTEENNNWKNSEELLLAHGRHLDILADTVLYFRLKTIKEETKKSGT